MAIQLTGEIDFTSERTQYPWGEWTNGRPWEAARGEDFRCTPESFVSYLHRYARLHNLKVHTRTVREVDPVRVIFKFTKPQTRGRKFKRKQTKR